VSNEPERKPPDEEEPPRLRDMPWMPWRIFEGRQVPWAHTPRDNETGMEP
jgi:hypothetical protein